MPTETPTPRRDRPALRWLLTAAAATGVILALRRLPVETWLRTGLDGIERFGPWGPVLFVVLYVIATVLLVPASPLTLGAGALFGVGWGTLYVSIASTAGATCSFLIGRHLARDAVARRIGANERFAAIDRAVAEEGWRIVGLTRLSPVFPFVLLNYAFGITRVRLSHYVVASWLGMLPGTVLYVYLGSLARVAVRESGRTPAEWVLYGIGLVATALVTLRITRIARRALARHVPPARSP